MITGRCPYDSETLLYSGLNGVTRVVFEAEVKLQFDPVIQYPSIAVVDFD